ncbi:MAG: hypothetical protein PHY30_01690 [Candidatus Pacebacteria bacterium]|nr:hypothetical protein [Candidatus Paceibacterota bacterium]
MSKKTILIIIFALVVIAGAIRGIYFLQESNVIIQNQEENDVKSLVENFGKTLKNVSLLSPTASQDIEENYKDFIAEGLLNKWKEYPSGALGRLTSSPWPEQIDIANIKKVNSNNYVVYGDVIKMTSTGKSEGEPIELNVQKANGRWLITEVKSGFKEFIDNSEGISFNYPENLNANYVFTQSWPPKISVSEEGNQMICPETSPESSLPQRVMKKTINGNDYCVSALSEGAAGTIYTEYAYSRIINNRVVSLDFVLKYPQCGNYPQELRMECKTEREIFNLDNIVDKIFSSIEFLQDISWNDVQDLISNCKVKEAFQAHSKEVKVTLQNGLKLNSKEPKIDDIIYLVDSIENKCGDIRMGTE